MEPILSATVYKEVAFGGHNDCISCFDDEGLIEFIRLDVTSILSVELAF